MKRALLLVVDGTHHTLSLRSAGPTGEKAGHVSMLERGWVRIGTFALAIGLFLTPTDIAANSAVCHVSSTVYEDCGCGEYAEVCDPPPASRDTCVQVCVKKRTAAKHYWSCSDGHNYATGGC